HESLEFFAAQQPARDSLPNCEIAFFICAGETFEPLGNRRTTLGTFAERLAVGHVFVRMKMSRLSDDLFGEIADVAHERVARKLAMFNFAQTEFPLAGELWAGQLRHGIF